MANSKEDFIEGLRGGIPIALGYLSVSFAYGIMAQTGGLDLLSTVLISMTNLTSAGQLAGTQLIFDAASYIEIAVTTFVINLRYMLMSLSLSQKVDENMTVVQRLLVSFGITDEIFAVSSQRKRPPNAIYMFGLILLPYIGWAMGTFLGSAAGYILPESVRSALGIAIYGMFVAIVIPVCKRDKACLFVAIMAGVISCCLKYVPILSNVPQGWAIIICAVVASVAGALIFPIKDAEGESAQ
ncbi:MAG: AzlC family ABC transporter permease [Oscillospiraceae bacterium]|nr:AzlC family ABC transporter permease [Oscillospiraceae bacterium]